MPVKRRKSTKTKLKSPTPLQIRRLEAKSSKVAQENSRRAAVALQVAFEKAKMNPYSAADAMAMIGVRKLFNQHRQNILGFGRERSAWLTKTGFVNEMQTIYRIKDAKSAVMFENAYNEYGPFVCSIRCEIDKFKLAVYRGQVAEKGDVPFPKSKRSLFLGTFEHYYGSLKNYPKFVKNYFI